MEQIPFYMTFPMQNLYIMELEYEKDMERMKSLYPNEVADMQRVVEDRCDELEYEGSRIFDEEPDRHMLQEEIDRLYDSIDLKDAKAMSADIKKVYFKELADYDIEAQQCNNCHDRHDDSWLRSMIGILFTNEIYRRRCRHRRCRRWW